VQGAGPEIGEHARQDRCRENGQSGRDEEDARGVRVSKVKYRKLGYGLQRNSNKRQQISCGDGAALFFWAGTALDKSIDRHDEEAAGKAQQS